MPKIFLIKNRLHQQQLKLLESQNLLAAKNDLGLGDRDEDDSHSGDGQNEPLSLVSRNRERDNNDLGEYFFSFILLCVTFFLFCITPSSIYGFDSLLFGVLNDCFTFESGISSIKFKSTRCQCYTETCFKIIQI